jgi:glucose-6-phosphate 1-dehydrogenase
MNAPISLEPNEIQNEKVKAIHNLYMKDSKDIALGQYEGYQEEVKSIHPNSETETYAALRVYSKDYRWRDMPIIISTGKNLTKRSAEIIIEFKKDQHILYTSAFNSPNRLIIRIQPMQELILEINNKKHGSGDVEPVLMTFSRDFGFSRKSPETYSKLIWECCLASKIMFIRSDEVQEAWRLVDQALAFRPKVFVYPKNTNPKIDFV